MRYELNIGLDVTGGDNSPEARKLRLVRAVKQALKVGVLTWDLIGDVTDAEEPALYVNIEVADDFDMSDLCFGLCAVLAQDCVAVTGPTFLPGTGSLIGPRAVAWGEFNPEYFRRPAVAVAA